MNQEQLDVVVIGAGLSGIGAAVHLSTRCPGKSFALLEMREAMGGTWDLFRYPGIRSDSDMYTLGYRFKPWSSPKAIAEGADILSYIQEAASESGVDRKIRYQHRVLGLDWSSADTRWHVQVERTDTGEIFTIASRFVICATGYYKYEHGHTPAFEGRDQFQGRIVHPQAWPEDLDYEGKRIVVIGSGATAITLVPALSEKAAHVTMLQRSPGYVANVPRYDAVARVLQRVLPASVAYALTRTRRVLFGMTMYELMRAYPGYFRKMLLEQAKKAVGDGLDEAHFSPTYDVWDERLCAAPDGDLFQALRDEKASVVTGHIDRFTERGIRLTSGDVLDADIVVTATGLEVQVLGGASLTLDGDPVNMAEKLYYKGAMLEDVPNLAFIFGYTNSSWTLKADLISEFFCRVIRRMDAMGVTQCTPRRNGGAQDAGPFVSLASGYVKRALHMLPRQGDREPWRLHQNYLRDLVMMKLRPLEDGALQLTNPAARARPVTRQRPRAATVPASP